MIISLLVIIFVLVGFWMVFKKMGRQGWEGIVPFYRFYILCYELYGNGWKFLFLLIPFYNIYFYCKICIDLAHAFHYGTGFGIGMILLPFIFLLILAFGSAQYGDGTASNEADDLISTTIEKTKAAVSNTKFANASINSDWLCEGCGKENNGKAVFCAYCGQAKPKPKNCPYCGHRLDAQMMFCPKCGKKYDPEEYKREKEAEARALGKKICEHCGSFMPIDASFCGKCGKAQSSKQDNEQTAAIADVQSKEEKTVQTVDTVVVEKGE